MRLCICGHGRNKHFLGRAAGGAGTPGGPCRGVSGCPCPCAEYKEDPNPCGRISDEMLRIEVERSLMATHPDRALSMNAHLERVFARAKLAREAARLVVALTRPTPARPAHEVSWELSLVRGDLDHLVRAAGLSIEELTGLPLPDGTPGPGVDGTPE